MSRTFLYARVSTADQHTDNQLLEVKNAGFDVQPRHIMVETISGSVPAANRPMFARLLDKLDQGDVLIVTKLDRLGRNTSDVLATVKRLADMGVSVRCLALGGVDLTSSTGALTMTVLAGVAQFERDQLIERTHAGLARAKDEGKKLGRAEALSGSKKAEAVKALADGVSLQGVADRFNVSKSTVQRLRRELKEEATA